MRIWEKKAKLTYLESECQKYCSFEESQGVLKDLINKELEFEGGFSNELIDSFIDYMEVYRIEDPKILRLKVFPKVKPMGEENESYVFQIYRKRKDTSVCFLPSI